MTALVSITSALEHPALFGQWFGGPSWSTWRAVLKAAFAEPMTDEEVTAFRSVADRDPPAEKVKELWVVAGRRGGKDSAASLIATHAAALCDYSAILRPGERATVLCLATDRDQAKIVFGYIKGYFAESLDLAAMVTRETADTLELNNGSEIIVTSNDFRSVRGRTITCCIFDEVAFWRSEYSASPDFEVYRAITPAQATVPGAILIGISSPYKRSGLLFDRWRRHYGKNGSVLVVKAASRVLNSTLPQSIVDAAMEADADAAAAEWMAEFRNDLSDFISREVVERCIDPGVHERPPRRPNRYVAFIDAAGGSGSDSMTLAIAHTENSIPTLDAIRERKPPFSPDDATAEFAKLMKAYNVTRAESDHWGGDWPIESFRKHAIAVVPSAKPKSDLYRELLPALNANRVSLLDHPRLISQVCSLERRVGRGGRDSIDHPIGGHDDLINATAGALLLVGAHAPLKINQRALEQSRITGLRHAY
jgi:hypothetical protein